MTTIDATIGPLVQQAVVSFNASGDNLVILGKVGSRIKVLQFFLVVAAATTFIYKSGSTALSGPLVFGSNSAHVLDYMQLPLTCNVSDSFIINSSAAVQVGGTIWYAVVI
jgi:hypothetical protein